MSNLLYALRFYLTKLCWSKEDIDCLIDTITNEEYQKKIGDNNE